MDGGAGAGAVKGTKTTSGGVMDVRSCTMEPVMEAVELGFITRILMGILGGLIGGEFFFVNWVKNMLKTLIQDCEVFKPLL